MTAGGNRFKDAMLTFGTLLQETEQLETALVEARRAGAQIQQEHEALLARVGSLKAGAAPTGSIAEGQRAVTVAVERSETTILPHM